MIKKLLVLLFISATAKVCDAQFYKSFAPSPEFSSALEKIVLDFRFNFETIKGNIISELDDVRMFESTVKLPGANECIIYYFNSMVDTTASWQAVMYRGHDYKEAARMYQNVFRLVKKSQVHWIDKSSIGFAGELETPKEELRFATSTLNFKLEDERYKKFKAEVELISTYGGWEVHLNLHSKKPDNEGLLRY
jgi:hypothetical protein